MGTNKRGNNLGIKKGAAWGVAVEPVAGDMFIVESHEPPKGDPEQVSNENDQGIGHATMYAISGYPAQAGTISAKLHAESAKIIEILASCFGVYNSSIPEAGALQHELDFKPVFSESTLLFHTVAWNEGTKVKAVKSAAFTMATISYDGVARFSADYIGDFAGIESGFTLPVTALSDGVQFFNMASKSFRMNAQGGALLQASDDQAVNTYEIRIARPLAEIPMVVGGSTISGVVDDEEPYVEVDIEFPSNTATTEALITAWQAGETSDKKMQILFEGGTIGATAQKYTYDLYLPRMRITDLQYSQDTPQPVTMTLRSMQADAAPTGMDHALPYMNIITSDTITARTGYPTS